MSEAPLELELQVGGTVPLDSATYVVRSTDEELLRLLTKGEYCNVLCPRQMGKTSVILRTRATLRAQGFRTGLVDIGGRLGTPNSADEWYLGLLMALCGSPQLNLSVDVRAWWKDCAEPTANQKLLTFFREQVLARHPERFVVFLDEIDHTLNLPYTDDFFLAIRSLYNDRAAEPDLKRLAFCLVGVFTPNELVKQQRTTTYNIGRTLELQDFDVARDDLSALSAVLSPEAAQGKALLNAVLGWTGGQPYLTASACKKIVAEGVKTSDEIDRVIEEAFLSNEKPLEDSDGTHFESISRFLGQRVSAKLETVELYRRILKGAKERERPTPPVIALKLSGLVKCDRDGVLVVRNRLYRRRFDRKWSATVVPISQRWARTVGAALSLIIVGMVLGNFLWLSPRKLGNTLAELPAVAENYGPAEKTWRELREVPFWHHRADELWAGYFRRRAERAESVEDRDAAFLWRLQALTVKDSAFERRVAGSLRIDDYERLRTTVRHAGPVNAAVFSPSGEWVLTASEDKTARVWNAKSGEAVSAPLKHGDAAVAVAFSPSGEFVVTGSKDQTARVWNAKTGQPVTVPLKHEHRVNAVAFSPSGESVATASDDRTARVWSAKTGQAVTAPLEHRGMVYMVAFSPSGEWVVSGSAARTARVWSVKTGKPVTAPLEHTDWVRAVAFSPSGEFVVTGSDDKTARVWSAKTGEAVTAPLHHEREVNAVAFSPSGEWVVTGSSDSTARVWNAKTGEAVTAPLKHEREVNAVAFSPSGEWVVSGSSDKTARVWSAKTGEQMTPPLQHNGSVTAVTFSLSGEWMVTGSLDKTTRVWNAKTGEAMTARLKHEREVNAAALSPSGGFVVTDSSGKTARVWHEKKGEVTAAPLKRENQMYGVTFSSTGEWVATRSRETARVWSAKTGEAVTAELKHEGDVRAMAFSPNGEFVVTGSDDRSARVWSVKSGEVVGVALKHAVTVTAVAVSPSGEFVVTGSLDETARVWSVKTGEQVTAPLKHEDTVMAVAFSPNGEFVVTGSRDTTARVWSAKSGEAVTAPLKHEDTVMAVAFSPSGEFVMTGSWGTTARVWSVKTGEAVTSPFQHENAVTAVAFNQDGHRLLTRTDDKVVHVFDVTGKKVGSRRLSAIEAVGNFFSLDAAAKKIVSVEAVESDRIILRTLALDYSDCAPIEGNPADLVKNWEGRLGLHLVDDIEKPNFGRLITTTGEVWIEGRGD